MAPAAVQRVGKGVNAASISIGSGDGWATPTAGNLLVATANSDALVPGPTGAGTWTAGPSIVDGNAAYLWWKVATGTETSVIWTPSVSDTIAVTLCEYSGVAASPVDVSNSSAINAVSGNQTSAAAITTTAAGDLVIAVALLHGTLGSTISPPTGPTWTNSFAQQLTAGTGGSADADCFTFLAELVVGAAGSYSTVCTWTNNRADRQHIIIAFKAAAGGTTFTATQTDTAGLTDAATTTAAYARTRDDTAGLADAASTVLAFGRQADDSAGLTDSASPAVAYTRTVDDSAGLTDTTAAVSAFARPVTDLAGLTDTTTVTTAGAGIRQVDDNIGLTDTATTVGAYNRAQTDTTGLADTVLVQVAYTVTVDDTAGLADTLSAAAVYDRTVTDNTGLVDAVTGGLAQAYTVTIDDILGLTDAATAALGGAVVTGRRYTTSSSGGPRYATSTAAPRLVATSTAP